MFGRRSGHCRRPRLAGTRKLQTADTLRDATGTAVIWLPAGDEAVAGRRRTSATPGRRPPWAVYACYDRKRAGCDVGSAAQLDGRANQQGLLKRICSSAALTYNVIKLYSIFGRDGKSRRRCRVFVPREITMPPASAKRVAALAALRTAWIVARLREEVQSVLRTAAKRPSC